MTRPPVVSGAQAVKAFERAGESIGNEAATSSC